jgi:hypothetical protein
MGKKNIYKLLHIKLNQSIVNKLDTFNLCFHGLLLHQPVVV